ncbi:MAG: YraN family protein [Solirubrobacteraceae bacterium]|nr:YraN family protein [Solirubrobacteraceae bacterium]
MKTEPRPAVAARSALALRGETLASEHLERCGFRIVERNARTRFGEIDVIAHGHDTIVFVEVKTRRAGGSAGEPLEAIDHRKVRQVRKLAASWLAEAPNRPSAGDIRFDAIGVTVDGRGGLVSLDHLEGAF